MLVLLAGCDGSTSATINTDEGDSQPSPTAAVCGSIENFEDAGNEHVAEGTEVEDYNSDPPTSGPHYARPADPGFFSTAPPAEQLVHNLEHGQIVIHFAPDAPEETVTSLQGLLRDDAISVLVVPNENLSGTNEIILTAWTALQRCEGFSEADIDAFRAEFQGKGPENVGVPPFDSGAS